MKVSILISAIIISSFEFKCYGQDIQLKSVDINFRVKVKQTPFVIKNAAEFRNFTELASNTDSLLKIIDFNTNYYVFVKFFHRGPSYCSKTYYECFIKDSTHKISIKPHIVGENAARLYKQMLIIVPLKYITKELVQVIEENHSFSFQTKEDIINICEQLESKFSVKN